MKFVRRTLGSVLVVASLALIVSGAIDPSPAIGVTSTSTPTADARINRLAANTNYGAISTLRADSDDYESLILFDAPGGSVTDARLRIYVTDPGAGPTVYAADSNWVETSVTWNLAPPAGALAGSFPAAVTGQWIEANVTSAVASGVVAFRIRSASSDGVSFGSRENANKPQLIVTTTAATPTASPTSAPTPSPTASPTASPLPTSTPSPTPIPTPSGSDPVILAAGDIASSGSGDAATALILEGQPGTILTLGDNAYPDGSLTGYLAYYDPTWGRYLARTRPVMGNHEYLCCPGAEDARAYFGSLFHSYDIGTWHLIALDAGICDTRQIAACDAGSLQERWLQADLAAHPNTCTLVYWHQPRWSSGSTHGSSARMQAFWADVVAGQADVVLTGHEHNYERFAPMDAAGGSDPNGVREFVVGTGGAGLYPFGTPLSNSEVRYNGGFGVLRMTLHPGNYDWQFLSVAGNSFTDSGTGQCH